MNSRLFRQNPPTRVKRMAVYCEDALRLFSWVAEDIAKRLLFAKQMCGFIEFSFFRSVNTGIRTLKISAFPAGSVNTQKREYQYSRFQLLRQIN